MDNETIYFGGYRRPQPGDYIPVYRNDQNLGWIQWTMKADPMRQISAEFVWVYAFGAQGKAEIAYTLEEAKQGMLERFLTHMESLGVKVDTPCRKPKAEDINWVKYYQAKLAECKTTKDVDALMAESERRRKELPKIERTQIAHEAGKLFEKFYAIENPEGDA